MARQSCFTLDGRITSIPTKLGEGPHYSQLALPILASAKNQPPPAGAIPLFSEKKGDTNG